MNCEEARTLLAEYWSQNLEGTQELAFEAHLEVCDACRAETERLGGLWKNLALLPAEEPGKRLRGRFYETLAAYRQGSESAPRGKWRERLVAFWPKQPLWQMGAAAALLIAGLAGGFELGAGKTATAGPEVAQLRSEVNSMRQLVALSLMQQQSAGERLRGVNWAYQVAPSDTEVLAALLTAVNQDASVNVRLAAADALHAFASSPVTRDAVIQAIPRQTEPLVQVALIDLLVDLKEKEAVPKLRVLASDQAADAGVRQRASWALERLQ